VTGALLLLALGWSLLLGAAALAPRTGGAGFCAALAAGAALALATRADPPRRRPAAWLALLALGGVAGAGLQPAALAGIAHAGLALGLPAEAAPPQGRAPLWLWLAAVCLAPVFEELLYRERLLPELARRFGELPGLVLSSAAFALPHLEPWSVLGTFLVGLALGALMRRTAAVSLCIGLHAGLNLAALHPTAVRSLPACGAALVGAAALVAAAQLARRSGAP